MGSTKDEFSVEHIERVNKERIVVAMADGSAAVVSTEKLKAFVLEIAEEIIPADGKVS